MTMKLIQIFLAAFMLKIYATSDAKQSSEINTTGKVSPVHQKGLNMHGKSLKSDFPSHVTTIRDGEDEF